MLCFKCNNFSLFTFCSKCKKELLDFKIKRRIIEDKLVVYSFYEYSKIKKLLSHKHYLSGYFVLNNLAKFSLKRFDFYLEEKVNIIAVDDDIKSGYSHTSILAKHLQNKNAKALYSAIFKSKNISYKGKSKSFRKANKKGFYLVKKPKYPVILVDDILTTGSTLMQAYKMLKKEKIRVLFAVVLADVKD